MNKHHRDFREMADPTVLYYDDKWYLYPSCGMAYVSEDFITWKHYRIEPYDAGYAPTVMHYEGRFYLTACEAPLYRSESPLGPFEKIGEITDNEAKPLEHWADPMLFADDDGSVYVYWGIGEPGIFGAELDKNNLTRCVTKPKILFSYNPEHVWERMGNCNEDATYSYVEGSWMFKHRDKYYLTYSAPGTHWKTYAMGCYVSDKPLGPFVYAKKNPFLIDTEGLVHAPGHGSIVRGPNNTIWAFYTCLLKIQHMFERRIGVDAVGIDGEGNLFSTGASEIPQWAPGLIAHPENGNDAGLIPVSVERPISASSEKEGRDAVYAVDNVIRTWWEPEPDDKMPWLEINLEADYFISAVRILWAEPNLDYDKGILPGPFQYKLEANETAEGGNWFVVLDMTDNTVDMVIDYRTFGETKAKRVRLTVTGKPEGMNVGVLEITVFGRQ